MDGTSSASSRGRTLGVGLALVLALVLGACARDDVREPAADTTAAARPVITATAVNDGTYGMMSSVRWAFSPDRRALLVVVNPAGVEAEAVPDGFFFGVEEPAFALQVDTVWDVAPAPDWRAVAYSRAFVLHSGEADSVPQQMWDDVARATGMDAATLRASAFDASGMAYAKGVAQPVLIRVPPDPRAAGAAEIARPRAFPIARGWRIRWTADGNTIALGGNPAVVQDQAPAQGWTALEARTGAVHGSLPANARMAEPNWVRGPELQLGVQTANITSAPPISVRQGGLTYLIESANGVITLRDPAFQTRAAIPVGAGVALAATASGRYIVALRPRQSPRQNEMPLEIVVYTVTI
jgi:hypothetical protein